jgi:hypothetical protein
MIATTEQKNHTPAMSSVDRFVGSEDDRSQNYKLADRRQRQGDDAKDAHNAHHLQVVRDERS